MQSLSAELQPSSVGLNSDQNSACFSFVYDHDAHIYNAKQKVEVQNMIENKRSPCSFDQGTFNCLATKRHKTELSISPKENKVKLGERITALQQLVSPYGKTDTASVLLEAMEYIQFLHEQVKVLSAPYLQSTPAARMHELEECSLRTRGLCLVPISCTAGVARSNGADIWAPIKTTSKFENTN